MLVSLFPWCLDANEVVVAAEDAPCLVVDLLVQSQETEAEVVALVAVSNVGEVVTRA